MYRGNQHLPRAGIHRNTQAVAEMLHPAQDAVVDRYLPVTTRRPVIGLLTTAERMAMQNAAPKCTTPCGAEGALASRIQRGPSSCAQKVPGRRKVLPSNDLTWHSAKCQVVPGSRGDGTWHYLAQPGTTGSSSVTCCT